MRHAVCACVAAAATASPGFIHTGVSRIRIGHPVLKGQSYHSSEALCDVLGEADSHLLASKDLPKLDLTPVFRAMADPSSHFQSEYWQKMPVHIRESIPCIANSWTMSDLEDAVSREFLLAGRGFFDKNRGGWKMAEVGSARGQSFEEAKLRSDDVRKALQKQSGTVVFNSVGASVKELAGVCLDALNAFEFPTCLNLYLTAAGQATSAPPHTDKQDVLVMQTQGQKRWRVYTPPAPIHKLAADPFARGKGDDQLALSELGQPLIDCIMQPGQILYIPAAFPHTTDTVSGIEAASDPSVHMTLGIDTHIWGLTHASMRAYILQRSAEHQRASVHPDRALQDPQKWSKYTTALALDRAPHGGRWSEIRHTLQDNILRRFVQVMNEVGENEWSEEMPVLREVAGKLVDHHRTLMRLFREMYSDVRHQLTPVPRDLGFLRSQPFLGQIEAEMRQLIEWANPAGVAERPNKPEKDANMSKGGFGGSQQQKPRKGFSKVGKGGRTQGRSK